LAQKVEGKAGFWCLGILDNDLGKDKSRDVFARGSIDYLNVVPLLKELRYFFEVHVATVRAVIEAPVLILFNHNGLLRHNFSILTP